MKRTNIKILFTIHIVIVLLIISPFLPGPSNKIVHILFAAGQVLSLFAFIAIPVALVWLVREIKRKRTDGQYKVDRRPVLLITIPLTILLAAMLLADVARDFSRNFAIRRASELIHAIDNFKSLGGRYPDSLTELIPEYLSKIPSPLIMGIDDYYYERHDSSFSISFLQNAVMNFDFEVVTFDPNDGHKSDGKLKDIFATGQTHWKYYIYD